MDDLNDLDRDVRLAVYRAFADSGSAPSVDDLAATVSRPPADVAAALDRLQRAHALVLAPGTDAIWMAHPFSAVPTAYGVRTHDRRYWANCAWDFFAIPALLGASGALPARCAASGATLEAVFDAGALVRADGVLHFTVPPRRFWANVAFT